MILADKIIDLRKKNDWSQEELAERVGVSRQSISKWECAQATPDLDKLLKLGQLFGVSTDYLLKDELEALECAADGYDAGDMIDIRRVTMEEANEFLRLKEYSARRIALGVFLCIIAAIPLILLSAFAAEQFVPLAETTAVIIGLVFLLVVVAYAVSVFVSCGSRMAHFEFLEHEEFETAYGVTGMVRERQNQMRDTYTRSNILGVVLCILGAIPLLVSAFVTETGSYITIGLACTLLIVGVGVFSFVSVGVRWGATQMLLQEGDYSRKHKKHDAVSGVYWMVMTAIFLGYSFITDDWGRSWIIWPVAGVLFAALSIILDSVGKDKK